MHRVGQHAVVQQSEAVNKRQVNFAVPLGSQSRLKFFSIFGSYRCLAVTLLKLTSKNESGDY